MVSYYWVTQNNQIFQTLSGKLSWSHISILKGKFKDKKQHLSFYARKSVEQGWSVRVLEHQIELKNFERTTKNQNNFKITLPKKSESHLSTSVKDEFTYVGNQYRLTISQKTSLPGRD